MMKKKLLYFIVGLLTCFVISTIIEIFGFNFNNIFNNTQSAQNVNFSTSNNNEKTTIKLDVENQYVSKLIIKYNAKKDTKYTLKYSTPDIFNGIKEISFNDIFDDSFDIATVNIRNHVSSIIIEYTNQKQSDISIEQIDIDNGFHFNFTRFIFIFITLILICSLIYFYKDGFKTEKIHFYFFIISSLLGTLIIISQPSATFYSFDDQIHFQNTVDLFSLGATTYSLGEYHLTESNIANSAGRDSINSIEEQQAQNELFDSGNSQYTKNITFAPTYNKIGYLPMAVGYHLAKIINLPFFMCFKIGKLFNLLFYSLLITYAIKIIKIGKRLLAIIALFPTNIFLASEYSYDPAVFIGLTIFIAHLINLFLDKKTKFDFKTATIMFISISYACFVKAIYAPFLLLALLIPRERFANKKQSRLVKSGIIAITILLLATFILPAISGTMESDPRGGDTSVTGQISSIMSRPLDYVQLLGNTAISKFSSNFLESFNKLSYIRNEATRSSLNFSYLLLILLIFAFVTDNNKNKLTKKQRLAILLANMLTIFFIWTALYLSFNPVGSNDIDGVQSRYFLPLLFPLLLCIQPKNIQTNIKQKNYNAFILIIPAIVNVITIIMSILSVYSY